MEGSDTINGRKGQLMVMCRQPLQTGLLMIPNVTSALGKLDLWKSEF